MYLIDDILVNLTNIHEYVFALDDIWFQMYDKLE
jgi:hypothetical protein